MEPKVLNAVYKGRKVESGKNAPSKHSLNSKPGQSVNSDKRVGEVHAGKMTNANDSRKALPGALKKLLNINKVCSFQMICLGLRGMAVDKSSQLEADSEVLVAAANGPAGELQAVISEVACDIHDCYVLKSSQDDPFRDVVIKLLRENKPNTKLKRSDIFDAGIKLKREITKSEYCKVMNELCVSKGSQWVFKGSDASKQ